MGSTVGLAIDVARAVELGILPGPRVIAAGRAIAMTGGHGWFEAIENALDAGVDSIEHGSFIDRKTARRMRESGTYLVPTMSVYAAMHARGPELGTPGHPHGTLPEELGLMVEAGATPLQAIRFGTSAAADLLAVGGDPTGGESAL